MFLVVVIPSPWLPWVTEHQRIHTQPAITDRSYPDLPTKDQLWDPDTHPERSRSADYVLGALSSLTSILTPWSSRARSIRRCWYDCRAHSTRLLVLTRMGIETDSELIFPLAQATLHPTQASTVLTDRIRLINKINSDIADFLQVRTPRLSIPQICQFGHALRFARHPLEKKSLTW